MQRKIFYRAGEPILATRGDGFFETVGTLQQLIEEGRRQQQDLAQWLQAEPAGPATEAAATTAAEPVEAVAETAAEMPAEENPAPAEAAEPAPEPMPPKRQRRRRPPAGEPDHLPDLSDRDPGLTATLPADAPRPTSRDRSQRWLVAGAARRGRAGKHWSTRQRG
ncbi:hypothetical protein [Roseicella frigidaeris]|nr:hypothetical protein [Roseicella frigidaeris]